MARGDPQTNLRLPAELKDKLTESAKASGRTFGAEVVRRLEESYRLEGPVDIVASMQRAVEKTLQNYYLTAKAGNSKTSTKKRKPK